MFSFEAGKEYSNHRFYVILYIDFKHMINYEGDMVFTSSRRIDFPMIDIAGIVYYPRFWDLAHRFYEESWEYTCGMHYNLVLQKHRIGFPLVHSEANFLHPLKYGDTAFCKISVSKIGNTSITWLYEISNQDDKLCWTANQTTVCTNMDNITEKINVPKWMREGLVKITS